MITALARSELLLLLRNRVAALMSLLAPIAFAVVLLLTPRGASDTASFVTSILIPVAGLGTYVTATSTLSARRQGLILKKLRLTALSKGGVMVGILGPVVAINVVQLLIIFTTAIIATGDTPNNPIALLIGILGVQGMFVAFALLSALWTGSAEQAQYTTLPLLVAVIAVSFWTLATTGGSEAATWHEWMQTALPGGALTQYIPTAWDPQPFLQTIPQLVAITGWAVVPALIAGRFFTWEPRATANRAARQNLATQVVEVQ